MSRWTQEYAQDLLHRLAPGMFEVKHDPDAVILAASDGKQTRAQWKPAAEVAAICHQVGWHDLAAQFVVSAGAGWTRALLMFPDSTFQFFKIKPKVLS